MTLKEYLNQKEPQRMPTVYVKKREYIVVSAITVAGETRRQVYFRTRHPLLAGVEYTLIGTRFYTTDRDGNPKNLSCFRAVLN